MGMAKYEIVGTEGVWRVRHDGKAENTYATKEAAFEAAIAAASLAIRQGHEVIVTAPPAKLPPGLPLLNKRRCRYDAPRSVGEGHGGSGGRPSTSRTGPNERRCAAQAPSFDKAA